MVKDIQDQNEQITPNSKQLTALKELFPACFKIDGSFDLERFKSEIADQTQVIQEGYELKFLGKSYAKLLASTDTTTVIQPNEEHNELPENENSENIYISGDNLDGIKHLLKSYNGQIKCIYIDPPYNTGSDGFVYQDKFNYSSDSLQAKLNISEEEADRILDLTKRGSASHSAWLMFMYSRLLLARDLLTPDGVIFISIDDNEQSNLKLLCDEVFGEENFVGEIIVKSNPRGSQSVSEIASLHEYLLLVCKDRNSLNIIGQALSKEMIDEYKHEDKLKGNYRLLGLRQRGGFWRRSERPKLYYPFFVNPIDSSLHLKKVEEHYIEILPYQPSSGEDGTWRWNKEKATKQFSELVAKPINREGSDTWDIFQKDYLKNGIDNKRTKTKSIWDQKEYNYQNGTVLLKELIGSNVFNYSKPLNLIKSCIEILKVTEKDIVLDFFSGSATSAHSIMQLNADDDGSRRFIAVQLPEELSKENPSQKAAFEFLENNNLPTTLDYVGYERIKRAAAKIKAEHPETLIDLGFKHFIIQEPNPNTLDKLEKFDPNALIADKSILDDFGKPTILATWMNADGYGLTAKPEVIDLAGYQAYYYHKHLYLIEGDFTLKSMEALLGYYDAQADFNPENMVLFGYSFPDWSINEMIEKNLKILDVRDNLKINYSVRY